MSLGKLIEREMRTDQVGNRKGKYRDPPQYKRNKRNSIYYAKPSLYGERPATILTSQATLHRPTRHFYSPELKPTSLPLQGLFQPLDVKPHAGQACQQGSIDARVNFRASG